MTNVINLTIILVCLIIFYLIYKYLTNEHFTNITKLEEASGDIVHNPLDYNNSDINDLGEPTINLPVNGTIQDMIDRAIYTLRLNNVAGDFSTSERQSIIKPAESGSCPQSPASVAFNPKVSAPAPPVMSCESAMGSITYLPGDREKHLDNNNKTIIAKFNQYFFENAKVGYRIYGSNVPENTSIVSIHSGASQSGKSVIRIGLNNAVTKDQKNQEFCWQPAPISCVTTYSNWSTCVGPCDDTKVAKLGTETRTVTMTPIDGKGQWGGQDCPAPVLSQKCQTDVCPRNCENRNEWTNTGTCRPNEGICGEGKQAQTRNGPDIPAIGGGTCDTNSGPWEIRRDVKCHIGCVSTAPPVPAPPAPEQPTVKTGKFLLVYKDLYIAHQARIGANSENIAKAWTNIRDMESSPSNQWGAPQIYSGMYMGPLLRQNPNSFDVISKMELNKKDSSYLQAYDFIVDYEYDTFYDNGSYEGKVFPDYFDIYKTYMNNGGALLFFYTNHGNGVIPKLVNFKTFLSEIGAGSFDTGQSVSSKTEINVTFKSEYNLISAPMINLVMYTSYLISSNLNIPYLAITENGNGKSLFNDTHSKYGTIWPAGSLKNPKSRLILLTGTMPFVTRYPGLTESSKGPDVDFAENIKALLRKSSVIVAPATAPILTSNCGGTVGQPYLRSKMLFVYNTGTYANLISAKKSNSIDGGTGQTVYESSIGLGALVRDNFEDIDITSPDILKTTSETVLQSYDFIVDMVGSLTGNVVNGPAGIMPNNYFNMYMKYMKNGGSLLVLKLRLSEANSAFTSFVERLGGADEEFNAYESHIISPQEFGLAVKTEFNLTDVHPTFSAFFGNPNGLNISYNNIGEGKYLFKNVKIGVFWPKGSLKNAKDGRLMVLSGNPFLVHLLQLEHQPVKIYTDKDPIDQNTRFAEAIKGLLNTKCLSSPIRAPQSLDNLAPVITMPKGKMFLRNSMQRNKIANDQKYRLVDKIKNLDSNTKFTLNLFVTFFGGDQGGQGQRHFARSIEEFDKTSGKFIVRIGTDNFELPAIYTPESVMGDLYGEFHADLNVGYNKKIINMFVEAENFDFIDIKFMIKDYEGIYRGPWTYNFVYGGDRVINKW